jgi:hypothetical protein
MLVFMAIIMTEMIMDDDEEVIVTLRRIQEANDLSHLDTAAVNESTLTQLLSVICSNAVEALTELENPRNRAGEDRDAITELGGDDDAVAIQQPRQRRVTQYDWERARDAVWKDYMRPDPIFNDRQFERIFRITRSVMQELRIILGNQDDFFTDKLCFVTGKRTISPDVKILFALKQLAYGIYPHAFLDYFQMGETTARKCVIRFAAAVTSSEAAAIREPVTLGTAAWFRLLLPFAAVILGTAAWRLLPFVAVILGTDGRGMLRLLEVMTTTKIKITNDRLIQKILCSSRFWIVTINYKRLSTNYTQIA